MTEQASQPAGSRPNGRSEPAEEVEVDFGDVEPDDAFDAEDDTDGAD